MVSVCELQGISAGSGIKKSCWKCCQWVCKVLQWRCDRCHACPLNFVTCRSMQTEMVDAKFYILLTVHLGTIRVNNQLDAFFNVFISLLYMFRATQCSSSGESIVSGHHLAYITLCKWPYGMQVRDLHTRRPPTQGDIYQMIYWYNWFSWWWVLCCSKHVEKWIKHIKKCVKLVINTKRWPVWMAWDFERNHVSGWHRVQVWSSRIRRKNANQYTCTSWRVLHVQLPFGPVFIAFTQS